MTKWRGIPAIPAAETSLYSLLSALKENLENAINEIDGGAFSGKSASIKISLQNVTATMNGLSASITNEGLVRASADEALAQQIQQLIVSGSSAVMTYAQSTAPTSPNIGDIWFDTDDNNRAHRYDGTSWVPVDDLRTIANTAAISNEQSARINGDNALATSITSLTSLVNTQDATLQANINTEATTRANADSALATRATNLEATVNSATTGNVALQARIATEESARASGDAANASSITALTATVGTKARTFYQGTTPTATAIGDLWLNTADNNKMKRWDGTSWVAADDVRIAAVVTQSSANASAIGDINAQYSVTVSAGKVTGFKLISSPTTSDFIVNADTFAVENSSGRPFQIIGGNVYINGSLISPGSVTGAMFASGIKPIQIVTSLPASGTQGDTVFLTTDNKLYRYTGTAWTSAVPALDIAGTLSDAQIASLAASKVTGQLTDAQLQSISTAKLTGSITSDQIASVVASKISGTLADAQIASLAASKVTGQLSDTQLAAISAAKVTGQIAGTQIADGAISTAKIAANSVTASQIAANTITAGQIAAGAITATQIAANTITGAKIAAGTIQAGNIAADTITSNEIAANAITANELAAGSVTAGKIAAGSITSSEIAVGTITAGNIAAGTITAAQIAAGSITTAQIAAGTIQASNIAASAITGDKIAANTINAGNIAAGTITGDRLVAGTISAAQLATTELISTSAQIGNLVVDTINIKNNSITQAAVFSDDTSVTASTSWQTVASVTSGTLAGSNVKIDFSARLIGMADTVSIPAQFRILRGATVIRSGVLNVFQSKQVITDYVSGMQYDFYQPVDSAFPMFHLDLAIPAGPHTYSFQILGTSAVTISERQMIATELRR